MKMQLITIKPKESGIYAGFTIKRELFDSCGLVDSAFCNITTSSACESGFIASGFSSIYKPTIMHDVNNSNESIDDFVKAVFSKMIYRTRSDIVKAVECQSDLHLGGYKEQLYYCKAWIIHPDFSDFLILQSYSTIVAAFQFSTDILWVFGFYSNTTSHHIAKFRNWVRYEYSTVWNYPRVVRLYNDSRTGKRAARKNIEEDFSSVISSALNQH